MSSPWFDLDSVHLIRNKTVRYVKHWTVQYHWIPCLNDKNLHDAAWRQLSHRVWLRKKSHDSATVSLTLSEWNTKTHYHWCNLVWAHRQAKSHKERFIHKSVPPEKSRQKYWGMAKDKLMHELLEKTKFSGKKNTCYISWHKYPFCISVFVM